MEPENKVCGISLILMLCIQHPLVIGPVLDTVQMEQTIEHLCTAAVLFAICVVVTSESGGCDS